MTHHPHLSMLRAIRAASQLQIKAIQRTPAIPQVPWAGEMRQGFAVELRLVQVRADVLGLVEVQAAGHGSSLVFGRRLVGAWLTGSSGSISFLAQFFSTVRRGLTWMMGTRTLIQLAASYAQCPAEELGRRLEARLATEPRCPVARYLLACQCLDRARSALAVRHMMVAHHAEPDLESAALLVFAGLNWVARRRSTLLPVLLDTWEEFRRPEFDRRRKERLLLDEFAAPAPGLERVAPLARRLWRLPIRTLRAQIREAIVSRHAGLYPLLTVPA